MAKRELSAQEEIDMLRGKLYHYSTEASHPIKYWLDTEEPLLHLVMGSPTLGIPYGKIIEVFGNNSQGKTVLVLDLAACAQKDGAVVAWVDLESSWDAKWVTTRGLDPDKVRLFEPYIGTFGKNSKQQRLIAAEQLFEEVERWLAYKHKQDPKQKIFVAFDSVAGILTDVEAMGGITDQNMRTNMALPSFLSKLLRRWVALARTYNAMMIFINQLRTGPVMFGNPDKTPGGKAMGFYCAVRVEVKRKKGGFITKGTKRLGIKGIIYNVKNKAGEGSQERETVGFKFFWDGRTKFIPATDITD